MGQLHKQIKHAIDISMGTKKLRELITALAIQGKIVPQVLSEGTASDLINANKDYGVNSKKNSWKKLSRIIPVSPPYQIPASWIWIRLQDVCEVNGGFAFQSSRYVNDGIRVVRISDFDDRGFKNDSIVRYDYSAKLEGYLLNINNIIMAMTGGTVGKSYLVKSIPEKMVVNQRVATIRISKYAIPDYIHFVIKSRLTQGFINSAKNSTNDNISMLDINSFWIPLPPIMEQKRIVEKVDHLMALCDKIDELQLTKDSKLLSAHSASIKSLLESKNADEFSSSWEFICNHFDVFYSAKENVEELKKAILTLAMKGKLVPQDNYNQESYSAKNNVQIGMSKRIQQGTNRSDKADNYAHDLNIPYNIPSSWQWNRLKDICFNWGQKKPVDKFTYIDVSSIDNTKGRVGNSVKVIEASEAPSRARKLVKKGSVIFSTVRPYLLNIAIVNEDYTPEPIASTAFAVLHPIEGISNRYLYWYLQSPVFLKYLDESMKGVAYPAISESDFFKGLIPIPPYNEQEQIADKIEHLVNICNNLTDKLEEAALKQTKVLESIVRQVTAS